MANYDADLKQLRMEIERLVADGMPRRKAEREATITVLARSAYEETADDYEMVLLDVIRRLESEYRAPVPTKRICAEVGAAYDATYYHLRKAERNGRLTRIKGRYSGWRAT